MIYYLYNTTESQVDCYDIGLSIAAGENHRITSNMIDDGYYYEGGDLDTALTSGDLVLTTDIDTPPGTQYTSAEAKIRLSLETWALEVDFDDTEVSFSADDVQTALEELDNKTPAVERDYVITDTCGLIFTDSGGFVLQDNS